MPHFLPFDTMLDVKLTQTGDGYGLVHKPPMEQFATLLQCHAGPESECLFTQQVVEMLLLKST